MPKEGCRDFQRGQCTRGRSCRYTHDGIRSRSRSRSRGKGRSRDREDREDPPARVFKEGDWNCAKCKGHNLSRHTDCLSAVKTARGGGNMILDLYYILYLSAQWYVLYSI
jgi:hypothetical protein